MNEPTASLQIFRAGTHTSVDGRKLSFTPQVLKELADSYDPTVSEAPLVVGHPNLDAPAYGWAKTLRTDGDVLYAEPHQVDPEFAALVNAGRFKKISSSIYLPDSPGNPKPGKHYIRHIGFLGAAAPSIKGLSSAKFAENDGALEFAAPLGFLGSTLVDLFQRMRDYFVERDGAEAADRIIPQWSIRSIDTSTAETTPALSYAAPSGPTLENPMTDATATALAQREQQITTRETSIAAREQAIKEREQQTRRADAAAFADQLVRDGKLLPRERNGVVEILLALPADTSVSFAEGDQQVTKAVGDLLRQVLTAASKRIDFSEKSGSAAVPGATAAFAAPPGTNVDPTRAEQHQRALAYQTEHNGTSYVDAVRAIGA